MLHSAVGVTESKVTVKVSVLSKKSTGLYALLLVLFVLSLTTIGCGDDGFLDEVIEGEKKNWSQVGESVTGPTPKNKDSGFVGSAGKVLCEARGYRWVASISACYEK